MSKTGTKTKKTDSAVLFWDEQGRISCGDHTPFRGSDTWVFDRWSRMTPANRIAFTRDVGRPAACETCAARLRRERHTR